MNRPSTVTLRPARPAEARALAEMSRDLIEAGLEWRYTPEHMAALIAARDNVALVACDGERVEGFALMHFGDEHAHLALLCVQPHRQRRGIGSRMIEWLTESALVAGIASVHLELRVDNLAAFAFYQGLGYAQTLIVPGYYAGHIAARRMARKLRDDAAAS